MDDERIEEIVGKLDEETKDKLKELAKTAGESVDDMLEKFCRTYSMDKVQEAYPDDEEAKIAYAMKVMKSDIALMRAKPIDDLSIYVIGKGNVREGSREDGSNYTVSDFQAIAQENSDDSDEIFVGEFTAWGNEVEMVKEIEYGESYQLKAEKQGSYEEENYVEYQVQSFSNPEPIDFKPDPKDIVKVLERYVPKIKTADAKEHISTTRDDYKMIRGTIQDVTVLTTDNGRFGKIAIYDDSIPLDEVEREGVFTVMCSEDMVRFRPPSEVAFIGNIRQSSEHGLSMWAKAAVPIIGLEYEKDPTDASESEISQEDEESRKQVVDVSDEEVKEGDQLDEVL